MSADTSPLYQDLDTEFVNLWSLLRNLTQRRFRGRVRVELKDYVADIFINESPTPVVREMDHRDGNDAFREAELHQVVLRARGTPGRISVFEETAEVVQQRELRAETPVAESLASFDVSDKVQPSKLVTEDIYRTGSYKDWPAILTVSGELIAAIERALNATGDGFADAFKAARLQLADDYSFLDPMRRVFEYRDGKSSLASEVSVSDYVSGLSEALRRAVDQVATGDRARRVHERVALELSHVARTRTEFLERSGFRAQLDRIAGARVM